MMVMKNRLCGGGGYPTVEGQFSLPIKVRRALKSLITP